MAEAPALKYARLPDTPQCATFDCTGYGVNYYERGGIGSHYCHRCLQAIKTVELRCSSSLTKPTPES